VPVTVFGPLPSTMGAVVMGVVVVGAAVGGGVAAILSMGAHAKTAMHNIKTAPKIR
jgi:hypothetical protein